MIAVNPEGVGPALPISMTDRSTVAIFGDVGTIYHYVQNSAPNVDCEAMTEKVIIGVLDRIKNTGARISVGKIYGLPERAPRLVQTVFVMGLQPTFIYKHRKKNTADIALAIDLTEHLVSPGAADFYVLIGGDSDYIPVIQKIKEKGKIPLVFALTQTVSHNLEAFIENTGGSLISVDDLIDLEQKRGEVTEKQAPVCTEDHKQCMRVMLQMGAGRSEIWMTPLLRELEDKGLGHLSQEQRKNLIRDFAAWGLVTVEKRKGNVYHFSVVIINYDKLNLLPDCIPNLRPAVTIEKKRKKIKQDPDK